MEKKIVIIGRRPDRTGRGLSAERTWLSEFHALRTARTNWAVSPAASPIPAGFTWDIGGHVMFSHYNYYDQVFDRLMGSDFQLNNRESWVRHVRPVGSVSVSEQHSLPAQRNGVRVSDGPGRSADARGAPAGEELRRVHRRRLRAGNRAAFHEAVQLQGVGASAGA